MKTIPFEAEAQRVLQALLGGFVVERDVPLAQGLVAPDRLPIAFWALPALQSLAAHALSSLIAPVAST
jgi:hypothetical protein